MKLGKKTVAAVGAVALLGAFAVAGRGEPEAEGPPAAAELAVAERGNLEVRAEAAGLVEPIRVVEVKSKASGEVLALHVETGDVVERGALLAEVDPRDVQNALEQAEADLEVARVRVQTAEANRGRMEELRQASSVTQQEYEAAVQSAADARATLVRARTNLQLARERRRDVTIRAPIGGTVIERSVETGQIIASATSNVSGGTTLLRMADLSEMQVRTLVDETDIGRVRPGQAARVSVEAYPGRTFRGEVLKVEPQAVVEQNVTMFPVLVRLENRDGVLKPGMNAEVAVEIARREDVVTVPNAAVSSMRDGVAAAAALGIGEDAFRAAMRGGRARGGGPEGARGDTRPAVVFVQGPGGPEPRRVLLGVSDWDRTEVLEGIEAGEKVVLISVARLQRQQQEFQDRIRERAGGPIPGAGGGRRGG